MPRSVRADPSGAVELLVGFQRFTAALASALTPEEVARIVAEEGLPLVGASGGGISSLTRSGKLRLLHAAGTPREVAEGHRAIDLGAPLPVAEAVLTGQPIWLESREAIEARYPDIANLRQEVGAQAWGGVPLSVRGRVVGALGLRFAEERAFDEGDRAFILALAEVCAQALDRAFLHRRAERSAERERSARERAEMATVGLAESEALFRACARRAPYAFAILDSAGRIRFANARAEAIAGRGAGELSGKRSEDVFPDTFLAAHLPALQRAVATGETQTLLWETAEHRIFALDYASIAGPGGGIEHVVASAFDVTERGARLEERGRLLAEVRARRELLDLESARREAVERASRAERKASELEAVLDAHGGGILVLSPAGEVRRINGAARAILGVSPPDAPTAAALLEHVRMETEHGRPLPFEETIFAVALQSDEAIRDRMLVARRADGTRRWLLASAAPLRDGGVVRAVAVELADVTALRELQEERGEIFRAASQDLRVPLGVIVGQAKLIQVTAEPQLRARVESIVNGADRLSAMLRDLEQMVRLESGRAEFKPELVDLKAFLLDLVTRVGGRLDVSRLRVSAEGDLPRVRFDPDELDRVVLILLDNALRYSAPDAPVAVGCREEGGAVLLSVSDRGQGIPGDELPRIFERFYRGRNARATEGLGLGLHIARLLVEAQGGRITAESDPGRGSVLRVYLPVPPPA